MKDEGGKLNAEGERTHAWLPVAGLVLGMVLLVAGAGLYLTARHTGPQLLRAMNGITRMDDAQQTQVMAGAARYAKEFRWGVYLTLVGLPVMIGSLWAMSRDE